MGDPASQRRLELGGHHPAVGPEGKAGPLTLFVRYGIGALTVLVGLIWLIFDIGGFGLEGLFGFTGAGLSIILINVLFRMGLSSEREREQHEADWRFYERHGHWPDEDPPAGGPAAAD